MIKNLLTVSALAWLLFMVSCSKNANDISNDTSDEFSLDQRNSNGSKKVSTRSTPNILLIIADDMGKDAIKGYQEGSIKPKTPNIDAIRDNGLLFTNFWVNPTCSPTRGAIITGKYCYLKDVKEFG